MGRKWTREEIKYLKENWTKQTRKQIARTLNRPNHGIYLKSKKLGLKIEDNPTRHIRGPNILHHIIQIQRENGHIPIEDEKEEETL